MVCILAEVLKALSRLSRDRVQQRLVVVFKIFSRNRFHLRFLELNMNMELFKVYAQNRVQRRFLELNTLIMHLGVRAEVEDLLEAFKALSQDRVQQLVVQVRVPGEGSPEAFGTCPQQDCLGSQSPTLRRLRMHAFVGDVPFFLEGSCRLSDHVTFAVRRGADGLEAFDLEVVGRWQPLTPSWVPWYFAVLAVFPLVVGRPASMSVWTRRTFLQLAGFTGDDTFFAMFPSFVLRPRCSASWLV